MPSDVWDEKRTLRARLRRTRATRSDATKENATEGLTRNLTDLVSSSRALAIACYLSSSVEPNTRPFLNWAFAQVITILFPIAREDGLLDWVIGDGESERAGLYGIPEVVGNIQPPIAIEQVQLIIAPALAVDTEGNRLGKGRGYYDKVLGSMTAPPP
ncbi:MAG TPA: 5-formyltetrahydrofolate cyclo-ligase, partial [Pseudoclavibacter sp.]|nr:5-formyltetrahydrofolate cyclo-ligase [Pseudoclavibacter sp.]